MAQSISTGATLQVPVLSSSFIQPRNRNQQCVPASIARAHTRAVAMPLRVLASVKPRKKLDSERAEAQDLVRNIMRNFSDQKPLLSTLNKYVKVVRSQHCFLLFEELGKGDNWLQCLEVCL